MRFERPTEPTIEVNLEPDKELLGGEAIRGLQYFNKGLDLYRGSRLPMRDTRCCKGGVEVGGWHETQLIQLRILPNSKLIEGTKTVSLLVGPPQRGLQPHWPKSEDQPQRQCGLRRLIPAPAHFLY